MSDAQLHEEPRYVVLLLGAGFSAPWHYPVMRDFTTCARRRQIALARDRSDPLISHHQKLFDFQNLCRLSSWAFNRDWDNIEELYSQADLLRLSEIDSRDAEDLCKSIAWSIWDTYRGAMQSAMIRATEPNAPRIEQPPQIRILSRIAEGMGMPIVAITTNYDILFEGACRSSNSRANAIGIAYPGFEQLDAPRGSAFVNPCAVEDSNRLLPTPHGNLIPVVKLHGSANWFTFKAGGDDKCIASVEHSDLGSTYSTIDGPVFSERGLREGIKNILHLDAAEIAPLIVPPMLGKMAINPILRIQWRAALHYLRHAAHLVVIGYSFPETDVFMPRLLSEGISQNLVLEQIAIVNHDDKNAWDARINRIFTPTVQSSKVRYYQGSSKDIWRQDSAHRILVEKQPGVVMLRQ
jgi:hypothetical protein